MLLGWNRRRSSDSKSGMGLLGPAQHPRMSRVGSFLRSRWFIIPPSWTRLLSSWVSHTYVHYATVHSIPLHYITLYIYIDIYIDIYIAIYIDLHVHCLTFHSIHYVEINPIILSNLWLVIPSYYWLVDSLISSHTIDVESSSWSPNRRPCLYQYIEKINMKQEVAILGLSQQITMWLSKVLVACLFLKVCFWTHRFMFLPRHFQTTERHAIGTAAEPVTFSFPKLHLSQAPQPSWDPNSHPVGSCSMSQSHGRFVPKSWDMNANPWEITNLPWFLGWNINSTMVWLPTWGQQKVTIVDLGYTNLVIWKIVDRPSNGY